MSRPTLRTCLILALASLVAACGSLPRPDGPLRIAPHTIIRVQDPRISANDGPGLQALIADMQRRITSQNGQSVLVLSGGGANGAYGAGVIVGWTERGDRPTFDMVTGVSTGALTAPFAFLGPDWDDELTAAYTNGQTQGILSREGLAILRGPSLFSDAGLRGLVNTYVTPELMQAVAAEHAKGRMLLVATTNLDTEETIIWNMGMLASQGEIALPLFRDVLVASASIPGVFPPVLIPGVTPSGEVIMEMHVDGSVNTPFLAIPEDLLLWTGPPESGPRPQLYVVLNGQAGRNTGVIRGRLPDILGRTYDSMSKATARQALAATGAFAARNNMDMSMTAIPDNVSVNSLDFNPQTMRALFQMARTRSAAGRAWSQVQVSDQLRVIGPNVLPEAEIPQALRPRPSPSPSPSQE